jgi:potassium channel subfamily K
MAITIIIIVFLTFNLAFLHSQNVDETRRLHHVQREFMIQTLSFFIYLGVVAFIFCRVENYTYVQSLYFMVVTFLTIGFGDITPKTTAFKVLMFPFTVTGITLLALIVTSIVRLLADRARRQKAGIKRNQRKRVRPNSAKPPPLKRTLTLQEELVKLREEEWIRERRANVTSVVTGLLVFLVFWFIGALIFHLIEVLRLKFPTNSSHGVMEMPSTFATSFF